MANIRIISNADFDTCILSSSLTMGTNASITNLQIGLRAKVARTTTVGTWVISGVNPFVRLVSGVSLYKHNLTSFATMKLQLYSDTGLTTQLGGDYNTTLGGVVVPFGNAFLPGGWGSGGIAWGGMVFDEWPASYFTLWLPAVVAGVLGFKITITDAGASAYYEIGRVYLGDYWTPNINLSYGLSMGWNEKSKQLRTDGGSLRTEGYAPYRSFEAAFDILVDSERNQLLTIFRKLGLRQDFLFSGFPLEGGDLENDYTSAVKLVSMPKIIHDYFDNYTTTISLEEV